MVNWESTSLKAQKSPYISVKALYFAPPIIQSYNQASVFLRFKEVNQSL